MSTFLVERQYGFFSQPERQSLQMKLFNCQNLHWLQYAFPINYCTIVFILRVVSGLFHFFRVFKYELLVIINGNIFLKIIASIVLYSIWIRYFKDYESKTKTFKFRSEETWTRFTDNWICKDFLEEKKQKGNHSTPKATIAESHLLVSAVCN